MRARVMATRPELAGAAGEPGVTIVTNALNIAHELTVRPSIKLVITGGVARPQSYELIGPLAGRVLDEITLDLMVLGVDARDPFAVFCTLHLNGFVLFEYREIVYRLLLCRSKYNPLY